MKKLRHVKPMNFLRGHSKYKAELGFEFRQFGFIVFVLYYYTTPQDSFANFVLRTMALCDPCNFCSPSTFS